MGLFDGDMKSNDEDSSPFDDDIMEMDDDVTEDGESLESDADIEDDNVGDGLQDALKTGFDGKDSDSGLY